MSADGLLLGKQVEDISPPNCFTEWISDSEARYF